MIPKRGGLVRGVTYIHTWGHAGGRRLTKKNQHYSGYSSEEISSKGMRSQGR